MPEKAETAPYRYMSLREMEQANERDKNAAYRRAMEKLHTDQMAEMVKVAPWIPIQPTAPNGGYTSAGVMPQVTVPQPSLPEIRMKVFEILAENFTQGYTGQPKGALIDDVEQVAWFIATGCKPGQVVTQAQPLNQTQVFPTSGQPVYGAGQTNPLDHAHRCESSDGVKSWTFTLPAVLDAQGAREIGAKLLTWGAENV